MGLAHYSPDYCLSTATAGKTSGNTLINDPAALNAAFRVRRSRGAFPVVVREFVCSSTLILEFSTLHKSPALTGGGGGVTEKNPTRRPSHNPPGAMSRATFEGCGALRWRKTVNLHQRATPFENREPGGESDPGKRRRASSGPLPELQDEPDLALAGRDRRWREAEERPRRRQMLLE